MKNFFVYFLLLGVIILGLFVFELDEIVWQFIISTLSSQRDKAPAILMAAVFSLLYLIPLRQNYFIKKELRREGKSFYQTAVRKINIYFFIAFFFGFFSFALGSFYMLKNNQSLGGFLLAISVISFIVYVFLSGTKIPAHFKYKEAFSR